MCGSRSVRWSAFRDMVFRIYVGSQPQVWLDNLPRERQVMLYHLCREDQFQTIEDLLNQTKHCLCSDPRDKIFALQSLIDPGETEAKIEPDYTKKLFEVYQDVMVQFITTGNLQLLGAIEMHEHLEGVPSWVPDWSSPRLAEPLRPSKIAGGGI
jgi:hypothetical protein